MAQSRVHDFRGEATSALLNQRWYEAMGNLVLNGLTVVPGSTGMKVTVQAGSGLIAGLTFVESSNLTDAVTLSIGHASLTRIDAIVAQYVRAESEPVPEVTFTSIQGTPSSNPQAPSVATNQLRLANVRIPANTTLLTSEMIASSLKLRDRIQLLTPKGVLTDRDQPFYLEGTMWERDTDPTLDATITVEVGDLWARTSDDPPSLLQWDGVQWNDIQDWDNIKNKPATFPVGVHALAGEDPDLGFEVHTGNLPLSRVTGHTAFGPPAHQEAFAGAVLRRP